MVDELLQVPWHVVWQIIGVIVVMRDPSVDLVQLKEDAGRTSVVVVIVFLNAWRPCFNVDVADLTLRRLLAIVAVVNVLTTSRNRARCLVC